MERGLGPAKPVATMPKALPLRAALGLGCSCWLGLAACGLRPEAEASGGLPEAVAVAATPTAAMPLDARLRPGRALLIDGARAARGLPGFGRNAIVCLEGRYALASAPARASDGGEGPAPEAVAIGVWYTSEGLLYDEPWRPATCPGLGQEWRAYVQDEADGSVLWVLSRPGYRLLARFPSGYAAGTSVSPGLPEPCRFLSVLADRFAFFHRYAERPEDVSFPAFLDLGGR